MGFILKLKDCVCSCLIGFLFCVLLVGLKVRVLIFIFIYVALRFDFLVFVHELVNELAHKGAWL